MRTLFLLLGLLIPTFAFADEPIGSLVIVGGGDMPKEVRDEFVRLAGGEGKAHIIVIPTASEYADDPNENEYFMEDWRPLEPASLERLHTRDRKVADDEKFAAPLREATGVWLSGGDQVKLIKAYKGTAVEKELQAVLKRGGVIGGTSAGAAVMSDPMIEGPSEEDEDKALIGPGFGFLPGILVDQHFVARKRLPRLQGVLIDHPTWPGLGIDESTAIIVHGDELKVLGASTVTAIWPQASADHPGKVEVWNSGKTVDLKTLCMESK